MTAEQVIDRRL